jgi:methylmalonyl-CoA mutase
MTPEYGAATQLEKIDMLDFADFVAINKFDRRGALDALRDVRKQYQRNRELFDGEDEDPAGVRHHAPRSSTTRASTRCTAA